MVVVELEEPEEVGVVDLEVMLFSASAANVPIEVLGARAWLLEEHRIDAQLVPDCSHAPKSLNQETGDITEIYPTSLMTKTQYPCG